MHVHLTTEVEEFEISIAKENDLDIKNFFFFLNSKVLNSNEAN